VVLEEIEKIHFEGLILSPGPGIPSASGNLMPILEKCVNQVPFQEVCLGHHPKLDQNAQDMSL
jgi:anthranilate synthase component 2